MYITIVTIAIYSSSSPYCYTAVASQCVVMGDEAAMFIFHPP